MAAGTTIARSANVEKRVEGEVTRSSPSFREEPANQRFGRLVLALSDVTVAHDAATVHEDRRGPGAHAVPLPDHEVVVLDDRVLDAEPAGRLHHLDVRLLPREFRAVDADDPEPSRLVPRVPVPQLRDHVAAVVSAVRPEFDEHDVAPKPGHRERAAVDPGL